MAEQDARKEDARDLQGQSNHEYMPPAFDKDNEAGNSSSPQATQVQGSEGAIGEIDQDKSNAHLNSNTLENQIQHVSNDSQVGTKVIQQCYISLSAGYLLELHGCLANLNA